MTDAEVLVLLSGGIDSAALLGFYHGLEREVEALYVDYGQPARAAEEKAVKNVAQYYSTPVRQVYYRGSDQVEGGGFVEGRNLLLLGIACREVHRHTRVISLGVHAGTGYVDCTKDFLNSAGEVVKHSTTHGIRVAAPFLEWSKGEILAYCREHGVPFDKTYSCERGSSPCGECKSCQDRANIYVG